MATKSKEKFDLTNVVKYAKNLTNKTENIFSDMEVCIKLDGYDCTTEKQILELLVGRLQRLKPNYFVATTLLNELGMFSIIKTDDLPFNRKLLNYCLFIIRFFDNNEWFSESVNK